MIERQYNPEDAARFILEKMAEGGEYKFTLAELKDIISDCMKQEEEYMRELGVFSEDTGDEKDIIYDEEDAFNYILGGLSRDSKYKKLKDGVLEDLVDDYLEYNYDYMVSAGLVE